MSKVSIEFNTQSSAIPLYLKYSGQCNAQDAYVAMDECGLITASPNGEIGNSMPSYVWHNRTLRFTCPNTVKGSALLEYLNSEDTQLKFQTIHDMHSVGWNGNNHVGKFTDDDQFEALKQEIESELEALDCAEIWEPYSVIESMTLEMIWMGNWDDTLVQFDGLYIDGDLKDCIIEYAQNEYDANGIESIPLSMREFIELD